MLDTCFPDLPAAAEFSGSYLGAEAEGRGLSAARGAQAAPAPCLRGSARRGTAGLRALQKHRQPLGVEHFGNVQPKLPLKNSILKEH